MSSQLFLSVSVCVCVCLSLPIRDAAAAREEYTGGPLSVYIPPEAKPGQRMQARAYRFQYFFVIFLPACPLRVLERLDHVRGFRSKDIAKTRGGRGDMPGIWAALLLAFELRPSSFCSLRPTLVAGRGGALAIEICAVVRVRFVYVFHVYFHA
jgi:hypothetical protein